MTVRSRRKLSSVGAEVAPEVVGRSFAETIGLTTDDEAGLVYVSILGGEIRMVLMRSSTSRSARTASRTAEWAELRAAGHQHLIGRLKAPRGVLSTVCWTGTAVHVIVGIRPRNTRRRCSAFTRSEAAPRRRPRTAGDRAGKQNRQFIGALVERARERRRASS
jgi:hypothetical protein